MRLTQVPTNANVAGGGYEATLKSGRLISAIILVTLADLVGLYTK